MELRKVKVYDKHKYTSHTKIHLVLLDLLSPENYSTTIEVDYRAAQICKNSDDKHLYLFVSRHKNPSDNEHHLQMATHIYLFIFFSLMTPNCTEMPQGWSVK